MTTEQATLHAVLGSGPAGTALAIELARLRLPWLRTLTRRLGELEEEKSMDAEDILTRLKSPTVQTPWSDRE